MQSGGGVLMVLCKTFGVNCNVDIDRDGVKDWLAAGRMGVRNVIIRLIISHSLHTRAYCDAQHTR